MLVVTTSVRMIHWVHSHSLDLGEDLLESRIFVEQESCLEDGLIISPSSGDDAHCGSAAAQDGFSGARWQSDSGFQSVIGVADDGGVSARTSRERSLVASFGLDVADGRTFGDFINGEDIADCDSGLHSAENVLPRVGALCGQEVFSMIFIFVRISEFYFSEWCSSSGIMDDSLDNTSDITMSLSVIEISVIWCSDSSALVSLVPAFKFKLQA